MSDQNEEKNLPPSEHKLQKAREKGQVASSQDFVAAVTTSIGTLYLLFAWPSMALKLHSIFSLSLEGFGLLSPERIYLSFMEVLFQILATILPILGAVGLAGILANIVSKRGIPFSMHPIKPDFKKINPAQIFKKVFSRRNATEFGISLVRITIWFVISGLIVWIWMSDILRSMECQGSCALDTGAQIAKLLITIMIVLLVIAGILDLPLQNGLFRFEQKMGHQEFTREMKETEGSPEVKGYLHSIRMETMTAAESADLPKTLLIVAGGKAMMLAYDGVEIAVPRIAGLYKGGQVSSAVSEAMRDNVPAVTDWDLVNAAFGEVSVGDPIPENYFDRVAVLLFKQGLI